jgi:hypothetical protein
MSVLDFDAAYRRQRFEELRGMVKRGEIADSAAAFAVSLIGLELDARRRRSEGRK